MCLKICSDAEFVPSETLGMLTRDSGSSELREPESPDILPAGVWEPGTPPRRKSGTLFNRLSTSGSLLGGVRGGSG